MTPYLRTHTKIPAYQTQKIYENLPIEDTHCLIAEDPLLAKLAKNMYTVIVFVCENLINGNKKQTQVLPDGENNDRENISQL